MFGDAIRLAAMPLPLIANGVTAKRHKTLLFPKALLKNILFMNHVKQR